MEIARKIQKASIEVAREAFNEASMSGLCAEGAMEAAIGAIQSLKLELLVGKQKVKE